MISLKEQKKKMIIFSENEILYQHHRVRTDKRVLFSNAFGINACTLQQCDSVKETNKYSPTTNSTDSYSSIIAVNEEIRYIRTSKRSNFEDAFGERSYNYSCRRNEKGISYTFRPIKQDVWISNCVFANCRNSETCGGAFSSDSTDIERVFIEETIFSSCTASNKGGGVYFINQANGQCVISRTRSMYCQATSSSSSTITYTEGQFACINVNYDASAKNEVNESIIYESTKGSQYSQYTLYLSCGKIICSSTNITQNECKYYTALAFISSYADPISCLIVCSSIVNNSAYEGCIYTENSCAKQLILTSNILYNKHENIQYGATIHTYANLFINESCILKNEPDYLFYQGNDQNQINNHRMYS